MGPSGAELALLKDRLNTQACGIRDLWSIVLQEMKNKASQGGLKIHQDQTDCQHQKNNFSNGFENI